MKVYYNTLHRPALTVLGVSNQKKAGLSTIDTGPRYVYFLIVFSREINMLSSVLSILHVIYHASQIYST